MPTNLPLAARGSGIKDLIQGLIEGDPTSWIVLALILLGFLGLTIWKSRGRRGETPPTTLRRIGRTLQVVLLILLVVGAMGALLVGSADMHLQSETARLEEDVVEFKSSRRAERPVLLGEPEDRNAVDHYRAIEWVLSPRASWSEAMPPEGMVQPKLGFKHAKDPKTLRPPKAFEETLAAGSPLTDEQQRLLDTYGGLANHVRAGLRGERCSWSFDVQDGQEAELPTVVAFNTVAFLMACQARTAKPADAARIGLEITVFGDDLARHPHLEMKLAGLGVQRIGLDSLARTLERPLSPAALRQVVRTLGVLDRVRLQETFQALLLAWRSHAVATAGYPLSDKIRHSGPNLPLAFGDQEVLVPLPPPVWGAYELRSLLKVESRLLRLDHLPYEERKALWDEVDREADGSRAFGLNAIGLWRDLPDQADQGFVRLGAIRVLAAALLHLREHGALPERTEDLRGLLTGDVPRDPFRKKPGPLTLVQKDGQLLCYSVDTDQLDDGGHEAKDLVVATRLPTSN